ncbi:MAG: hypothetical protein V3U37_03155 [Nitrospinaceae bacterium]
MSQLKGHCEKCQAPVFLNRTVDWYGNSVVTLNCWNGHYEWIYIEGIEEDIPPVKVKKSLVTRIGFFTVS